MCSSDLPPCISPSFSLHSAPPRDVRLWNGLAFPWLGMIAGWAGVAWPAWASRRERTRWRLHRRAVPKVRGAGDVGVGRRFRPCGHPAQPACPEGLRLRSALAPHLPKSGLYFTPGLAFCLVSAVQEALGKPEWENAAVSFSGDRLPSLR